MAPGRCSLNESGPPPRCISSLCLSPSEPCPAGQTPHATTAAHQPPRDTEHQADNPTNQTAPSQPNARPSIPGAVANQPRPSKRHPAHTAAQQTHHRQIARHQGAQPDTEHTKTTPLQRCQTKPPEHKRSAQEAGAPNHHPRPHQGPQAPTYRAPKPQAPQPSSHQQSTDPQRHGPTSPAH